MDKFNANNPKRIHYWILDNIHMVWDQLEKLKKPIFEDRLCLRIEFGKGSYPIVMQWSKTLKEESNRKKHYTTEDVWYVMPTFSSIRSFADWVIEVKPTEI